MSAARQEVLDRIRRALGQAPASVEVARDYQRTPLGGRADVARFLQAVGEYRAGVHRVAAVEEAATRVAELVGDGSVVVAHDLPPAYVAGLDVVLDAPERPLTARELDAYGTVVT